MTLLFHPQDLWPIPVPPGASGTPAGRLGHSLSAGSQSHHSQPDMPHAATRGTDAGVRECLKSQKCHRKLNFLWDLC